MMGTNSRLVITAIAGVLVLSGLVSAEWTEQAKLNPYGASSWNYFGIGVGISGDYAIVGSTGGGGICASGAGYIFKRQGELWVQQAKLPTPYGASCDQYGKSVSISGNYAIISAVRDSQHGDFSGAAYIFERVESVWTPQLKLTASEGQASDNFGYSVAISGDYALIGAWGDDDRGTDAGAGYIFKHEGSTWIRQSKLKPGSAGDRIGLSASICDDYAIIGGRPWPESRPGKAYIYKRSGTSWIQQALVTAFDGEPTDRFGYDRSVSISEDFAVVGAAGDDDIASNSGAAYVFARNGTSWTFHTKLTAWDGAAGDGFGNSVSISGNYLVIGAYNSDDNGSNSGSLYSFRYDGANWVPVNKVTPSVGTADDNFGYSVSISGDHVLVGATSSERNVGSAYVFTYVTPPAADADGPYSIYVGDTLTLDAKDSTDEGDDIVSYMWDLDDDGSFETDAGDQPVFDVNFTYLQSIGLVIDNTYNIHLKVTDSKDQSDFADSTLIIVPKPAIVVAVDIKPGSCPNPVNVKSRGVLPIAILGSNDCDITTIDPASIRLAGVEPLRSGYEDVATPVSDTNDCNCTTDGPDGFIDLTVKFKTQRIIEAIGDVNDGDVRVLTLTGVLSETEPFETPIEGTDCILIRGKHKAFNKADINKDGKVDVFDFAMVADNWLSSIIEE